jgi:hypothetical protein
LIKRNSCPTSCLKGMMAEQQRLDAPRKMPIMRSR